MEVLATNLSMFVFLQRKKVEFPILLVQLWAKQPTQWLKMAASGWETNDVLAIHSVFKPIRTRSFFDRLVLADVFTHDFEFE